MDSCRHCGRTEQIIASRLGYGAACVRCFGGDPIPHLLQALAATARPVSARCPPPDITSNLLSFTLSSIWTIYPSL